MILKTCLFLYITNRHTKDILRSISHELVHHYQNCIGELNKPDQSTEEGYAQEDPHLREMEKQAYEQGNIIFRDFEDERKQQKVLKEMKDKEVNPLKREKANDHYVNRADKVYKELVEKWGFNKKEEKKEETGDKKNDKP